MKKYIFILFFHFLWTNSFAADFFSLERAEKNCMAIYPDHSDSALWRCISDAHKNFRESTKLNSLKSYANNMAFIWEQMGHLTQDLKDKKISGEEYKSRGQYLLRVRDEIGREARGALRNELNDITDQMAAQQSLIFIDRVVRNLSGQTRASDSNSTTFVINGRFINCRRFGALINCN